MGFQGGCIFCGWKDHRTFDTEKNIDKIDIGCSVNGEMIRVAYNQGTAKCQPKIY